MYLSNLNLFNFRNYKALDLDTPNGMLVFTGDNAQGKSNFLEAIYMLSIAKAYRAASDRQAIYDAVGANITNQSVVSGIVNQRDGTVRISVEMLLGAEEIGDMHAKSFRKDVRVDGIKVSAIGLVGIFNAVLFDSDDVELVYGPPATRRKYLDILISQLDRVYLRTLNRYRKIVYNRNRLLRRMRDTRDRIDELSFWNESMVNDGAYIILRRNDFIRQLTEIAVNLHEELSDSSEDLVLEYDPCIRLENFQESDIHMMLSNCIEDGLDQDIRLATSQCGPHRDDITFKIGGRSAHDYASRGQARTLALVMKLAEAKVIEKTRGESPVLLLDDVLSDLDTKRRKRLLENISVGQQVLITATDTDKLDSGLLDNSVEYEIEDGNIRKC